MNGRNEAGPYANPEEGMMNDGTRVMRRPWRTWPPAARAAAAIVAAATLAVLAAACGGSPSSTGAPHTGGSASSPSAVAYSVCVRSHGVPEFPDPDSGGSLPKTDAQRLGVSNSQLQAAQRACQHLLPNADSLQQQAQQCFLAGNCPQALVQQLLTAGRRFARCMRSHGVPNWPDPSLDSEGRPIFNLIPAGITHSERHSPPVTTKIQECQRLDPAPLALESN
jgi:hypothetical protein